MMFSSGSSKVLKVHTEHFDLIVDEANAVLEHGRATWQYDMNVQILSDVSVALRGFLLVGFRRRFEPSVAIHATVTQFLCHIPSNLPLCGGRERVSLLSVVLHEMLCKITASDVKDGVMQSVTLVDGTMCDEQHFRETETFGATVTMFSSGST